MLWCTVIYENIVLLLRTLRFQEIKTCEPTEEMDGYRELPRLLVYVIYV
jgi:hypothetical protein